MEGLKKSDARNKCREKCEKYVLGWNPYIHFKVFNAVFESAWKNKKDLRQIRSIKFSKEVLEWFLNLENYELSPEILSAEKERRPNISIKKYPFTIKRIKFLFTLFVWTKVQENYLEKPNIHYLSSYEKRFKEDADLMSRFTIKNEQMLLYDLGFININHALGIDPVFMNEDVFKIPVTEHNCVILSGEDLYKCGFWLEKQKRGFYICQNCGTEVLKTSKIKGGRPNKYCKECAAILGKQKVFKKGQTIKQIKCIICGENFDVPVKTPCTTFVCKECQQKLNEKNE